MIRFIALGGFLGAGKTTTMLAAAGRLEAHGHTVAVITNDQGTELIDTRLVRSRLDAVGEVTGGCFCCRFEDLMDVTDQLLDDGTVDTVLAEAVGSCTDLQATVIRPLLAYHGTRLVPAPLTVVVDPHRYRGLGSGLPLHDQESDLAYLFGHQLAEADVIAVNKADLLSEADRRRLLDDLAERHPHATVLAYSARLGNGLEELIDTWHTPAPPGRSVDIDYDRYAAAEAGLAWFNQTFTVEGHGIGFSPERWVGTALAHLSRAASDHRWVVGHAKISIASTAGLTKASVTSAGEAPTVDVRAAGPVRSGIATVNARLACEPEAMDAAAAAAVMAADAETGAASTPATDAGIAFKPGYPRPVHRITDPVN